MVGGICPKHREEAIMSWWYMGKGTTFLVIFVMTVIEFLKLGIGIMKLMSACDLKRDDWKHIALYDEYTEMRKEGEKVDYILTLLSQKYNLSESTIKRVVKRLSQEVRM